MDKRGTVMRDASAGPGLVIVQGLQYPFGLEGIWRSETLPRPGLVVDVDFDTAGRIRAMTAVPEAQLVREQAEAALALAREKGSAWSRGMVRRHGLPRLLAVAVLIAGWFLLSFAQIETALFGTVELTFWQVLGLVNSTDSRVLALAGGRGPGAGLHGGVAIACLCGPFLAQLWPVRRAHLLACAPFALMVFIGWGLASAAIDGAHGGMLDLQSPGAGLWVSLLASICLAALGVKDFLVGRAGDIASIKG